MKQKQQAGYSLLESLVSIAIGAVICALCTQQLLHILQIYLKMQQKFRAQHAHLIAKYYISADLNAQPIAVNFYAEEQRLHFQYLDYEIEYSIRKNELFRDDLEHNAVALVKNVKELQADFYEHNNDEYKIIITITFVDKQLLEIPCVLH